MSEKPVLICTMGLPNSGKSTWAKQFSDDHGIPIVNPDSVRLALHGQRFQPEAERFVWATAHVMVKSLFLAGHRVVIVDATNTTRKRRDEWKSDKWDTFFHLFPATKSACIHRARLEDDHDIIPVIDRMAEQWEPLESNEKAGIPLGATGTYSDGKISEDDKGDLRIAIAADRSNKIVRIEFGTPTTWLGLPKESAKELADSLMSKAAQL